MAINRATDSNKITITSVDEVDRLLNDDYRITGQNALWQDGFETMQFTLTFQKDEEKIIADATQIGEYVIHLKPLYDFSLKREAFVWVPETDLYFNIEEKFFEIAFGDLKSPIASRTVSSKLFPAIYDSLHSWLVKYAGVRHKGTKLSEVLYSACLVTTKKETIETKTCIKESLSLEELERLVSDAQNYDESIAMSFLLLSDKPTGGNIREILIGMVMYDLKRKQALSFNIQSVDLISYHESKNKGDIMFSDLAIELFSKSVTPNGVCNSFLPSPIYSSYNTALLWFSYIALQNIQFSDEVANLKKRRITIPEFLVFGYSAFVQNEGSFDFVPFSATRKGSASCTLKFNEDNNKLPYNLRIDRSMGERQIHVDFQIYDSERVKLVKHHALDLEQIYKFSPELFIAILAAAMYDGYFSTIISEGIKGVAELARKNAAYFYPLKFIWMLENAILWFNEDPSRYGILLKLAKGNELTVAEKEIIKYMRDHFLGVVAVEKEVEGPGLIGNAILFRHDRDQTNLRMQL